jgi:uncharacterized membrane protein
VKKNKDRLWEIDLFRGIAIVMMITFHILFDLNYFKIYTLNLYSGFFLIFAYGTAMIFIILVGISLTLSFNRIKNKLNQSQIILKYIKRGLIIFGFGLIITLITWLFIRENFIVFGVLHFIGLAIILAVPFFRFRYLNLLLGIGIILAGFILRTQTFDFYWLLWLGFIPSKFTTVDYFPLLPWFGVVLIGIFIGNLLYSDHKRKYNLNDYSEQFVVKFFCFLGRYSLIIYLLHQIIIVGVIYLFFNLKF